MEPLKLELNRFLGRSAELILVRDLINRAPGHGAIVLISGSRGIGKTTFLHQVRESLKLSASTTYYPCGVKASGSVNADTGMACRGPRWTISAFDDLHCSSSADSRTFARLCAATRSDSALVLATYRETRDISEDVTLEIARALELGAIRIVLRALPEPDIDIMLASLLAEWNLHLDVGLRARLIKAAAGNPGLLHELFTDYRLGILDVHLITSSIRARLSRFRAQTPTDSYRILQVAALMGQRFHADWLACAVADKPIDIVAAMLEQAEDSNLLYRDRASEDRFCFSEE